MPNFAAGVVGASGTLKEQADAQSAPLNSETTPGAAALSALALAQSCEQSGTSLQNIVPVHKTFPAAGAGHNMVFGQLLGTVPKLVLADFPSWLDSLQENERGYDLTSTPAGLALRSVLPFPILQKIGLLRASGVDESKITLTAYNISMAETAVRLGAHIRALYSAGEVPQLNQFWQSCRFWRIGRLDARTHEDERVAFSTSRLNLTAFYETAIQQADPRYGHLIDVLVAKLRDKQNSPSSLSRVDTKALQFSERPSNGVDGVRVSLRHSMMIQGQLIPLTELRAFFNSKGDCIPSFWATSVNGLRDIHDFILTEEPTIQCNHGVMLHTRTVYMNLLLEEVIEKLADFGNLLKNDLNGVPLTQGLTVPDLKSPTVVRVVSQLAEIHYLLAHATFDFRGSAAKSELLVRSLAVSAGLELPAFAKGFVPDLEAFVSSKETYIKNYLNGFQL